MHFRLSILHLIACLPGPAHSIRPKSWSDPKARFFSAAFPPPFFLLNGAKIGRDDNTKTMYSRPYDPDDLGASLKRASERASLALCFFSPGFDVSTSLVCNWKPNSIALTISSPWALLRSLTS